MHGISGTTAAHWVMAARLTTARWLVILLFSLDIIVIPRKGKFSLMEAD